MRSREWDRDPPTYRPRARFRMLRSGRERISVNTLEINTKRFCRSFLPSFLPARGSSSYPSPPAIARTNHHHRPHAVAAARTVGHTESDRDQTGTAERERETETEDGEGRDAGATRIEAGSSASRLSRSPRARDPRLIRALTRMRASVIARS